MKLFSSKSLSTGSEMMLSSSFLNTTHIVKTSPRLCYYRGISQRASYYSCTLRNSTNNVVGQQDLLNAQSSRINGTNGLSSTRFFNNVGILDAFDDEYEGVVINPERLPSNPNIFVSSLRSSMYHWKAKENDYVKTKIPPRTFDSGAIAQLTAELVRRILWHCLQSFRLHNSTLYILQGKKGVWLKLPLERSDLVPLAVKEGFEYHHAEKSYVMMTYWIPNGPSLIPPNASHHVGVGSFVINDKDEVLVVQEKHSTPDLYGLWKMPTGFVLESEEIYTGAVREVKEETGIDTEFVEVVAFRHAQNVSFEKSDLFFVCMLRSLSTEIMVDDLEIQAAKWMPLDEFVNQPLIQEDSMFKKIIEICVARLGKLYCGLSVHQLVSKFDGKLSSLYFNLVEDHSSDCHANRTTNWLV